MKSATVDRLPSAMQPVVVLPPNITGLNEACIGRARIENITDVYNIFGEKFQRQSKVISPDSARAATSNMYVKGWMKQDYSTESTGLRKGEEITIMSVSVSKEGTGDPYLVGRCKVHRPKGWIEMVIPMQHITSHH
jgi:hypothetical protein